MDLLLILLGSFHIIVISIDLGNVKREIEIIGLSKLIGEMCE